jgi:hypothetical protein
MHLSFVRLTSSHVSLSLAYINAHKPELWRGHDVTSPTVYSLGIAPGGQQVIPEQT